MRVGTGGACAAPGPLGTDTLVHVILDLGTEIVIRSPDLFPFPGYAVTQQSVIGGPYLASWHKYSYHMP